MGSTLTRQGWSGRNKWRPRLGLAMFIIAALCVIYITNLLLTQRFTETTRNRAEVRLAEFSSNLKLRLERYELIPQALAADQTLARALADGEHQNTSQILLSFIGEAADNSDDDTSIILMDADGRIVAATDRNRLQEDLGSAKFFVDAIRDNSTLFNVVERETAGFSFVYSRRVRFGVENVGVVAVEVDLQQIERGWSGAQEQVMVTDSTGVIMLASEPRWRGLDEVGALALQAPSSVISRALRATSDWVDAGGDGFVAGQAVFRREERMEHDGWKIISFTPFTSVRERVNGVLALEIMGFAILLATAFWLSSRKTASRALFFQRESADLRALNLRLQQEIAERERAEKNLEVAEQTIAQSSKLAVLGEMSAGVSHELNQPLAAMKTYLAGARLLLTRKRPDEALASFQRIDDLIDRMGAITRQLKSYARKGEEAFAPVEVRASVSAALSMMEPQLKVRDVRITRTLPSDPVMIQGDQLRLEQVIINLLRNALDATKNETDPAINIMLAAGDTVVLTVRDNGEGIEDLDELFEPFYTTKQAGDGVGLGLAISSGIVNDLGGRLIARNGEEGGAVFEVQLPRMQAQVAAE